MREKQVMIEAEEEMTRMRDAMEARQFEDKSATLLKSEGIIITFLFHGNFPLFPPLWGVLCFFFAVNFGGSIYLTLIETIVPLESSLNVEHF